MVPYFGRHGKIYLRKAAKRGAIASEPDTSLILWFIREQKNHNYLTKNTDWEAALSRAATSQ